MAKGPLALQQKASQNSSPALLGRAEERDTLSLWRERYFAHAVTTLPSSQKVQRRGLDLFIEFMRLQEGTEERARWTPRLSKAFLIALKEATDGKDKRRWSDRTVNRILMHLKTFARWIHKLSPFPLGNPMEHVHALPVGMSLDIERALTPSERRRLLDAADLLLEIGGRSKDRARYRTGARPRRKGYRPYRNRALVYTLIETGMRRGAVSRLNVNDVNFAKGTVTVEEKGGVRHTYQISREGLAAIRDYLNQERPRDNEKWHSPALFLASPRSPHGSGRLSLRAVNRLWNEVCRVAGVTGKTPHSARHAMGRHIVEKTGNVAAVQRQLGHRNARYSMQYMRITAEELRAVLNDR